MNKFLVLVSLVLAACSVQQTENKGDLARRGIAGGTRVGSSEAKAYGAVLGLQIGRGICTGTHIGNRFILTAWHCIGMAIQRNGGEKVPFSVVSPFGPTALKVSPEAYKVHYPEAEDFMEMGDGSGGKVRTPIPDIALIEILVESKEFEAIPNAKIASGTADEISNKFTIAGYGVNSFSPTGSSGELYKASTQIVKTDKLIHMLLWSEGREIGAAMPGDSGGPLFVFSNGVPVVYGVLSSGLRLNAEKEPAKGDEEVAYLLNRYSRTDTKAIRSFLIETMGLR